MKGRWEATPRFFDAMNAASAGGNAKIGNSLLGAPHPTHAEEPCASPSGAIRIERNSILFQGERRKDE